MGETTLQRPPYNWCNYKGQILGFHWHLQTPGITWSASSKWSKLLATSSPKVTQFDLPNQRSPLTFLGSTCSKKVLVFLFTPFLKDWKFIKFGCLPQVGRRTWEQRNAPCKLRGAGIETLALLGSLRKHQVSRKPSKNEGFRGLEVRSLFVPHEVQVFGIQRGEDCFKLKPRKAKVFRFQGIVARCCQPASLQQSSNSNHRTFSGGHVSIFTMSH